MCDEWPLVTSSLMAHSKSAIWLQNLIYLSQIIKMFVAGNVYNFSLQVTLLEGKKYKFNKPTK